MIVGELAAPCCSTCSLVAAVSLLASTGSVAGASTAAGGVTATDAGGRSACGSTRRRG